jgi:hypothetical protein
MAIYRIFSIIFRTFYFCSVSYFLFVSTFFYKLFILSAPYHDEDGRAMLDTQLILYPPFQLLPQQATTKFLHHQHNPTIMQINLKILLFGRIPPKIQTPPYLSDPFQFKTTVQPSPTVRSSYHRMDLFLLSVLIRLSPSLHPTS